MIHEIFENNIISFALRQKKPKRKYIKYQHDQFGNTYMYMYSVHVHVYKTNICSLYSLLMKCVRCHIRFNVKRTRVAANTRSLEHYACVLLNMCISIYIIANTYTWIMYIVQCMHIHMNMILCFRTRSNELNASTYTHAHDSTLYSVRVYWTIVDIFSIIRWHPNTSVWK